MSSRSRMMLIYMIIFFYLTWFCSVSIILSLISKGSKIMRDKGIYHHYSKLICYEIELWLRIRGVIRHISTLGWIRTDFYTQGGPWKSLHVQDSNFLPYENFLPRYKFCLMQEFLHLIPKKKKKCFITCILYWIKLKDSARL